MHDHLICYDISDPARLARVHRSLKRQAVALQYSVFLYSGDARQLQKLMTELASLIHPREDDLRAYPLPQRGLRIRLGKTLLPEGIQWSGLPTSDWQHSDPPASDDSEEEEAHEFILNDPNSPE